MRCILKNKKAQGGFSVIATFALVVIIILLAALAIGVGTGIITFFSKTINEATAGLGEISGANMTQIQEFTIGNLDSVLQQLKWFSAIILIGAFIGILMFAFYIRAEATPILLGIFFLIVIILMITSFFVSNMYEEFYKDGGEIGLELQSMSVTSFLILYLPHIIAFIAFISGVIIFTGEGGTI